MGQQLLILAIPIFLLSLFAESVWMRRRGPYPLTDALTSISMGLGNLGIATLLAPLLAALFLWFYDHRLWTLPRTPWVFVAFIFAEDYAYYWFHRISHEHRLWWCAHETHHSSEQYNFSTAVRQTWTGAPLAWIFWAPLAWLGIPPEWIVLQQAVSLIYQFFLHTEWVRTLGPLEGILNTPSHHRVHHATNLAYLDRNYAGIFILWDRLHGTFEPEREHPRYGTLSPVGSFKPWVVGFHMWVKLGRDLIRAPRYALQWLWQPPGWAPGGGTTTRSLRRG